MSVSLRPAPDQEANGGDLPLCSKSLCPFWDRYRCSYDPLVPLHTHFCVPELRRIKREHTELLELGKAASAFATALKKVSF